MICSAIITKKMAAARTAWNESIGRRITKTSNFLAQLKVINMTGAADAMTGILKTLQLGEIQKSMSERTLRVCVATLGSIFDTHSQVSSMDNANTHLRRILLLYSTSSGACRNPILDPGRRGPQPQRAVHNINSSFYWNGTIRYSALGPTCAFKRDSIISAHPELPLPRRAGRWSFNKYDTYLHESNQHLR